MKKMSLFFLSVLLAGSVLAQQEEQQVKKSDNPEFKTVFGKGTHSRIPIGYFIDLNAAYTVFNSKSVFLPGLSAGIILNHHWTIGLTGNFLGNPWNLYYDDIYFDTLSFSMHDAKLTGGFGGGLFEYTLLPNSAVHVSFPLVIGVGYLQYTSDDYYDWDINHNYFWNSNMLANSWFFYVEPGVRAEFNMAKKLRLGIGVSYRYSPKVDLPNTPTTLVNQFTARLNLRFGKF
jgi:hypothetical protein